MRGIRWWLLGGAMGLLTVIALAALIISSSGDDRRALPPVSAGGQPGQARPANGIPPLLMQRQVGTGTQAEAVVVAPGRDLRVVARGSLGMLFLSPSGRLLAAFQAGDTVTPGKLSVVRVSSGEEIVAVVSQRPVDASSVSTRPSAPLGVSVAWSPAEDTLGLLDDTSHLVLVDLVAGRVTARHAVERPSVPVERPLRWSPDGSHVAYCTLGVQLFSRDGRPPVTVRTPVDDQPSCGESAWAPVGATWLVAEGFDRGIHAVDPATGNARRLPRPPDRTPDRRYLVDCPDVERERYVYLRSEGLGFDQPLPVWNVYDVTTRQWRKGAAFPPCHAVLSPDGARWAAASDEGLLVGRVADGQAGARPVTVGPIPLERSRIAWTRDGERLVLDDGTSLYLVQADGSGGQNLTERFHLEQPVPNWQYFPAVDRLLIIGSERTDPGGPGLIVADPGLAAVHTLQPPVVPWLPGRSTRTEIVRSPDGRFALVAAGRSDATARSEAAVVDLGQARVHSVEIPEHSSDLAFAPPDG